MIVARNSERFDVVVVGGGGSGLSAAVEAARLGRRVVLLEKGAALGGSTERSVGSVTATSTPPQIRAGIVDSPDDHFEDLALFSGPLAPRDNPALRRLLVDNVPDTFRWLIALGVEFLGPMPERPHRRSRMHTVLPSSRSFIYHLAREARRAGVELRLGVAARQLLVRGKRIVGVEADANGQTCRFEANGAVVLATGDFGGSAEMKAQYVSADAALVDAVNPLNTGDGHRMALELGGEIVNADLIHGPEIRFVPPRRAPLIARLPPVRSLARAIRTAFEMLPMRLMRPFLMGFLTTVLAPSRTLFEAGAVLVNAHGARCGATGEPLGIGIAKQPGKIGYIVFDARIAALFSSWPNFISTAPGIAYAYLDDYRHSRPDLFHKADTVSELARALGMAESELTAATASLGTGPYYALGPVSSYIIFTDGGLRVNARLQVLRRDGSPIDGLYAAGAAGQGGLLLEGHGHHLGWAFTSGRIAGRHAALHVTSPADVPAISNTAPSPANETPQRAARVENPRATRSSFDSSHRGASAHG